MFFSFREEGKQQRLLAKDTFIDNMVRFIGEKVSKHTLFLHKKLTKSAIRAECAAGKHIISDYIP